MNYTQESCSKKKNTTCVFRNKINSLIIKGKIRHSIENDPAPPPSLPYLSKWHHTLPQQESHESSLNSLSPVPPPQFKSLSNYWSLNLQNTSPTSPIQPHPHFGPPPSFLTRS